MPPRHRRLTDPSALADLLWAIIVTIMVVAVVVATGYQLLVLVLLIVEMFQAGRL